MKNSRLEKFTVTVFSDVHHGDRNYNIFTCTRGLEKLSHILRETPDSLFYINLGDAADYLKDGSTGFYDQVAECMRAHGLHIYTPDSPSESGKRNIYNLIGNHEASYLPKSALAEYVPFVEGVGSVFAFAYNGVLFLGLDAHYDANSGSDDPAVIIKTPPFHIPTAEREWIKAQADKFISGGGIEGIVWLSHIAFKDIDEHSARATVKMLYGYGLPVTIFEGHAHIESFYRIYADDRATPIADVHTLPAVTSGPYCAYYVVTFEGGKPTKIDRIEKRLW